MADHHVDIFWSDEAQAYIANLPDFEYCSAHGRTPEDALRELLVAKEAWLEVAREHGDPITEPRY